MKTKKISFNGAVASQPRKEERSKPREVRRPASMGPWLRSHGRQPKFRQPRHELEASMGPWLRSHGRPMWCVPWSWPTHASMGPWLRSHGRNLPAAEPPRDEVTLQWGRGFAATEGGWWSVVLHSCGAASMGPWLRSHGRSRVPFCFRQEARQLQWGRGFAATEGAPATTESSVDVSLQWGRGFAATEGGHDQAGQVKEHGASMGPWLRSHGRTRRTHHVHGDFDASMGPWLRSHGRKFFRGRMDTWENELQWGRGFAATEGGSSEVVSYYGPRVPVASTPAALRLLPTVRINTGSVNRFIPAN